MKRYLSVRIPVVARYLARAGALAGADGYGIAGADRVTRADSLIICGTLDLPSSIYEITRANSIALTGGYGVAGAFGRVGVAAAGRRSISCLQIAGALGLIDTRVEARREDPRQGGDAAQAGDLGRFLQEIAAVDLGGSGKTDQLEDLWLLFRSFFNGLDVIIGGLPSADWSVGLSSFGLFHTWPPCPGARPDSELKGII